jgi:DnaJ-class molecular chaperone
MLTELAELEVKCESCQGEGGDYEQDRWSRCPYCKGRGYMPTETGERLLAFMRHNFNLMLEDAKR